jgi:hypothetical protein
MSKNFKNRSARQRQSDATILAQLLAAALNPGTPWRD